jgi:hypothetical protein
VLKSTRWTAVAIAVYALLAAGVLVLALSGRPVLRGKGIQKELPEIRPDGGN